MTHILDQSEAAVRRMLEQSRFYNRTFIVDNNVEFDINEKIEELGLDIYDKNYVTTIFFRPHDQVSFIVEFDMEGGEVGEYYLIMSDEELIPLLADILHKGTEGFIDDDGFIILAIHNAYLL